MAPISKYGEFDISGGGDFVSEDTDEIYITFFPPDRLSVLRGLLNQER